MSQTPVGMSAYFMHSDPAVYPEPKTFRPERWVENVTPAMIQQYVPFCRGSRNCLGQKYVYFPSPGIPIRGSKLIHQKLGNGRDVSHPGRFVPAERPQVGAVRDR